jgi:hypothetical protein
MKGQDEKVRAELFSSRQAQILARKSNRVNPCGTVR